MTAGGSSGATTASEYSHHHRGFSLERSISVLIMAAVLCWGTCSWPHDINHVAGGHVAQPFPDVCMAISTVWYLTDVGPDNGSTWVVPGSVSQSVSHPSPVITLPRSG